MGMSDKKPSYRLRLEDMELSNILLLDD